MASRFDQKTTFCKINCCRFLVITDVDECVVNGIECPGDGVCINSPGSYSCQCAPGFQGNGTHCEGKKMKINLTNIA